MVSRGTTQCIRSFSVETSPDSVLLNMSQFAYMLLILGNRYFESGSPWFFLDGFWVPRSSMKLGSNFWCSYSPELLPEKHMARNKIIRSWETGSLSLRRTITGIFRKKSSQLPSSHDKSSFKNGHPIPHILVRVLRRLWTRQCRCRNILNLGVLNWRT